MMSARENTRRLFDNDKPERVGLHDSPRGHAVRQWLAAGNAGAGQVADEGVLLPVGGAARLEQPARPARPVVQLRSFGFSRAAQSRARMPTLFSP